MSREHWRALSIRQPWIAAIVEPALRKRVENRQRSDEKVPTICKYRGPLLLHASSFKATAEDWTDQLRAIAASLPGDSADMSEEFTDEQTEALNRLLASRATVPRSAIVAQCVAIGMVSPDGTITLDAEPSEPLNLKWHDGDCDAYGLIIDHVRPTRVVPCSGALGLWRPPQWLLDALQLDSEPTAEPPKEPEPTAEYEPPENEPLF